MLCPVYVLRALCPMKCLTLIFQNDYALKRSRLYGHSAFSCIVISMSGPHANGAFSAFGRVSRHKTILLCTLSHFFMCVFVYCQIYIIQDQDQVQVIAWSFFTKIHAINAIAHPCEFKF